MSDIPANGSAVAAPTSWTREALLLGGACHPANRCGACRDYHFSNQVRDLDLVHPCADCIVRRSPLHLPATHQGHGWNISLFTIIYNIPYYLNSFRNNLEFDYFTLCFFIFRTLSFLIIALKQKLYCRLLYFYLSTNLTEQINRTSSGTPIIRLGSFVLKSNRHIFAHTLPIL